MEALAVDKTEADTTTSPAAVSDMGEFVEGPGFVPGRRQHLNFSRFSSRLAIETTLAGYEERRRRNGDGENASPYSSGGSSSSSTRQLVEGRREPATTMFPYTIQQQRAAKEEQYRHQNKQTWLSVASPSGAMGRLY